MLKWFRILVLVTLLLALAVLYQQVSLVYNENLLARTRSIQLVAGTGIAALGLVIILLLVLFIFAPRLPLERWLFASQRTLKLLGKLNFVLFLLTISLFAFLFLARPFGAYTRFVDSYALRLFAFWLLCLFGALLLKSAGLQQGWGVLLAASALIAASGFKLASFLSEISTSPFSLGWSEASRYYYASLFFSKKLYGIEIPPTVLHPTRYLMQAVPFLIPGAPLLVHRIWQVLLWLVATPLTAWLLARRLKISQQLIRLLFILWTCLFLLMAPVYYHLLVPLILVLWGFNRRRFWQSLLVVLLASAWAGISRVNWYPVPGLLAAILYFLEQPLDPSSTRSSVSGRVPRTNQWVAWLKYLLPTAAWVLAGSLVAFAAQAVYVLWSGNPSEQFSSSFSSDLLWDRLFPSATYPLGILPAAVLASLPLLVVIIGYLLKRKSSLHWLRALGVTAILVVLFLGGLVVSVKIGGGSNLHNLDAYLAMLLVVAGYAYFNQISLEETTGSLVTEPYRPSWLVTTLIVLLPVLFTLSAAAGEKLPTQQEARQAILAIQEAVDQSIAQDKPVLFISQRQLLMFNMVHGPQMYPDYENVFLMEMAMANNLTYLGTFSELIKNQTFGLIISDPLKISYQDRSDSFGEENNAWVDRVARVILCAYEPKETIKAVRTQILIPRTAPDDCQ